jgi:hypothetical protein
VAAAQETKATKQQQRPAATALAKIEAAHASTISDEAFDGLLRWNGAWLAAHYATALEVFKSQPRPQAEG